VPPQIVAAIARGSEDDADELVSMYDKLVSLLHEAGIYPVSLSADGTDVERTSQHIIESRVTSFKDYVIANSHIGADISVRIHYYVEGRPFVCLQDSNHAQKTGRNQLYTGARAIVIGNSPCYYRQLHQLGYLPNSPLFRQDVERADKQDDRAAARVFSAATLDCHLNMFPERTELAVYFFVIGEMVDAYQNRHITHLERATMVMMARYFLMAWRAHIDSHPDYSLQIQFCERDN
jgi:hypothetical protein